MLDIKPVKKLLYATDLSEGSAHALGYVVGMIEALDARVHVVHALEPLSAEARITLRSYVSDPKLRSAATSQRLATAREVMKERQDEFWTALDPAKAALRDRIARMEVVEGNPADVILTYADRIGADMIVMGSHEHGLNHTYLGRIAQRVLRRARIPTLIIPYPED